MALEISNCLLNRQLDISNAIWYLRLTSSEECLGRANESEVGWRSGVNPRQYHIKRHKNGILFGAQRYNMKLLASLSCPHGDG